jgi:hypothetical protein
MLTGYETDIGTSKNVTLSENNRNPSFLIKYKLT